MKRGKGLRRSEGRDWKEAREGLERSKGRVWTEKREGIGKKDLRTGKQDNLRKEGRKPKLKIGRGKERKIYD